MKTDNTTGNPENLIRQLADEEKIASAFEELVSMGDRAVPALAQAVRQSQVDREILYSVLSSIESDAAFEVLTKQLYQSRDPEEQALLALMLAKDGRAEIAPWLEKQLPGQWQNGQWWRKAGNPQSEFIASVLAALIALDQNPAYGEWFEAALDEDDPRKQDIAEFIGDQLNEGDDIEYEEF